MRRIIVLFSLLLGAAIPAGAQVSIGIGLPSLSIGINFPVYPQFVPVPGYPVYYDPQVNANYFFYDGMYWVYASDNWYASSWYNGPWAMVEPMVVPVFILRVPVRYYRNPPPYFHGWQPNAPPRWGDHWGNDWQHQRNGWDQWNHKSVPAAAPLPTYQKQFTGKKYPSYEQQKTINVQNNHYQPNEPVVQKHYQQYVVPKAAAPSPQKPPQQQQPSAQQHGSPGQGQSGAKEPKQEQGKDEGGDKNQDKEGQRDNR
jgi:hypothetical protein